MKTIAFVIVGLALLGGAYWYGTWNGARSEKLLHRCPQGFVCILESSGDPSPIIITDGSTNFAQWDQWTYEGKGADNLYHISALLPAHHVKWLTAWLCTPHDNQKADYDCDSPAVLPQTDLNGKSWTLFICSDLSDNCVKDGSSVLATVSLNKDDDWPPGTGADKGIDMVVKSATNFTTLDNSPDGKRMSLLSMRLQYAKLQVESDTPMPIDCHTSNPAASHICVVKICYSNGKECK